MPRDPYEDHPPEAAMSLGEHLEELRRRVIFGLLGLVPLVAAGLYFGETILAFLVQPALDAMRRAGVSEGMQTTSPLEGFNQYMKVAFILAAVVGAPWLVFQLWKFVSPGLYARERRFAYILGPMSIVLSLMGITFMYYVMLPMVLFFFVEFNAKLMSRKNVIVDVPAGAVLPLAPVLDGDPASPAPGQMWINRRLNQLRIAVPLVDGPAPKVTTGDAGKTTKSSEPAAAPVPVPVSTGADSAPSVVAAPVRVMGMKMAEGTSIVQQDFRISEYVSMVLTFAVAFAIAFQTPVVVLLLGWIGILKPWMLNKYRKHAIFACVVVGAVIGPADPFSMFALAIPLYLLYEGGLILLRVLPAERVARGFSKRGDSDTHADGDGGGEGPDRPVAVGSDARA
jgi:sec-independent protein translocase protein TatC